MHILITGGTGFIGQALCRHWLGKNHDLSVLSRSEGKVKQTLGGSVRALTRLDADFSCDAVVNLAGENIAAARWSTKQKEKLLQSRIKTTRLLIDHFKHHKPDVFISASAIGYYGSWDDTLLTEDSGFHTGFTHDLCAVWEQEAQRAETLDIRTCITRLGVVLDKQGGALAKMLPPFYMGLGGVIGTGEQYMSWVHRNDVVRAFDFLLENKEASGIYNLTAPEPVTNQEFTRTLAKTIDRPAFMPMPSAMAKLIWGEMGEELLVKGQRVAPTRLNKAGFVFDHENLSHALAAC